MRHKTQSFWASIPGSLTGIAAVITAFTGFYHVMSNSSSTSQPTAYVAKDPAPLPSPPMIVNGSIASLSSSPSKTKDEQQGNSNEITVNQDFSSTTTKTVGQQVQEKPPFPETGPLVDCTLFPTVNTVTSLMTWSNYYHQQVISADAIKDRASAPCSQAIDNRGMAHCKAPTNLEIRQALLATLTLCRASGIEWQDIQHSPIIN